MGRALEGEAKAHLMISASGYVLMFILTFQNSSQYLILEVICSKPDGTSESGHFLSTCFPDNISLFYHDEA